MKLALEKNMGAECASLQEALHALKIGFLNILIAFKNFKSGTDVELMN